MGSLGMLLADWSIALVKSHKKKGKDKKDKKSKEVSPLPVCSSCREKHEEAAQQREELQQQREEVQQHREEVQRLRQEQQHLAGLIRQVQWDTEEGQEDGGEGEDRGAGGGASLGQSIHRLVLHAKVSREQLQLARGECSKLAKGIGHQLEERDRAHSDRIKSLEILMNEKEKQLLQTSNLLRQQLAAAHHEIRQLEQREERILDSSSCGSLEQEVQSLRLVLQMRRVEVEQLRAANNSLLLEMERCRGVELQLQQQTQRAEEMKAVINNKNVEIRRFYEEHDMLTHKLEIEETAHLSCQQELEQSQWTVKNFITSNREKVGDREIILDLVQKRKSVGYSINC